MPQIQMSIYKIRLYANSSLKATNRIVVELYAFENQPTVIEKSGVFNTQPNGFAVTFKRFF